MDGLIVVPEGVPAALDIAYGVLEADAHAMLALDHLTLLSAEGNGQAPAAGTAARQPFSLEFRGPLDPQLAQATYQLVHADLGSLAVFLVPIARDPEGMRYQAIFA